MLYIIGLGLSDEKDITLRGLEVSIHSFLQTLSAQPEPRSHLTDICLH